MYYFIFGAGLSILFISYLISNNAGEPPKFKIKCDDLFVNGSFYIGSRHIHHWFLFSGIFVGTLIFKHVFFSSNFLEFLAGFSLMMIVHGLSYEDCFVF